ncbi:MAG: DUF975 family protein [Bacillota bacterium]
MEKQRYLYKKQAEENMVGKYSIVIPTILIFGVVQSGLSALTNNYRPKYEIDWETYTQVMVEPGNPSLVLVFSVIAFLIGAIILYATTKLFIQTAQNETPVIEDILLVGMKENPMRSIALQFLITLFVVLWTILLIIPGIVKAYAYSMSFYLLHRKPELNASEAIDRSKELTRGYKMDLFILDLSYLGWYFIGLFTLGILWFWIYPKHITARTLYFNEIFEIHYPKPIINPEEEIQ